MDLIIRHACLKGRPGSWDIGVSGDRIVALAEEIRDAGDIEIDAVGNLVMPTYVNGHIHLDKCFLQEKMRPNKDYTFGRNDQQEVVGYICHTAHMAAPGEIEAAFDFVTYNAAHALCLQGHGLEPGCKADLMCWPRQLYARCCACSRRLATSYARGRCWHARYYREGL
jgi:cytosine/adenosine deaminase-related metal-dependent hydrolase